MDKKQQWVQVKLERPSKDGVTNEICWLEKDPKLKVGSLITLKDYKGKWKVISMSNLILPRAPINVEWKVGGLSGRRKKL